MCNAKEVSVEPGGFFRRLVHPLPDKATLHCPRTEASESGVWTAEGQNAPDSYNRLGIVASDLCRGCPYAELSPGDALRMHEDELEERHRLDVLRQANEASEAAAALYGEVIAAELDDRGQED